MRDAGKRKVLFSAVKEVGHICVAIFQHGFVAGFGGTRLFSTGCTESSLVFLLGCGDCPGCEGAGSMLSDIHTGR